MSKQISKDNREYWQNKLENKFREKRKTIESLHQAEINAQTQKNFPIFKKRLGLEKDIANFLKVEKDFNDYSKNYEKRLERRDSKRDEVEIRRNNKLKELGYSSDYDFEDFRNETILNEVYSVMVDMILQKNHRASSTSNNLQDSS